MSTDSERVTTVLLDVSGVTTLALLSADMGAHKDLAQHQIVISHGGAGLAAGVLRVRGVPQEGKLFCRLTTDLEAINFATIRNPTLFFQGYFDALTFELTTALESARDVQVVLTSSNDFGISATTAEKKSEALSDPSIDAFGRLRVSSPVNLWTSEFQYNKHPLYFDEVTAVGGTATHLPNESAVELAVTTASGSKASLQTFEYLRYQPGKSQAIVMTFVAEVQANTDMRIGYFDDDNGWFLELNGLVVNMVRRTKTSGVVVNNKAAQADWNVDKLDGTGPSGITLDLTKGQILWIDLQWLSLGRVRMGFDIGGKLTYCHEFNSGNIIDTPHTTTANLPVHWEIQNTATAAAIKTLTAICASVFAEGGDNVVLGHTFTGGNEGVLRTGIGSTPVPIASIRPALTLNGITNRTKWVLDDLEIFTTAAMCWQIIYAPTSITGATFAVGPVAHSAVEVDITGTAIVGGVFIHGGYIAANNKGGISGTEIRTKFPLALDAAGTDQSRGLSIVVRTISGTNKSAAATFNWVEVR